MYGYWFKSSKFEIEPGEDEDINPRIYGRQLAVWLKARLEECGYPVEDVIDEDWGRCLMCAREPFWLWVGCANVYDFDTAKPGEGPLAKEDVTWHCFVTSELVFLKRLFGKKVDPAPTVAKLYADLGRILKAEPQIRLVDEP